MDASISPSAAGHYYHCVFEGWRRTRVQAFGPAGAGQGQRIVSLVLFWVSYPRFHRCNTDRQRDNRYGSDLNTPCTAAMAFGSVVWATRDH
jgi:hypothetical protein